MIDLIQLSKPFQELIHMATGLPLNRILRPDQAKPGILDPYCIYNIQPLSSIGAPRKKDNPVKAEDCNIPDWEDSDQEIIQRLKLRVSCNFFHDGAKDHVWKMKRCNYKPSISRHLFLNEIQWSGAGTPNNLTDLVKGEYDQRWQIDINIVVEGVIKDLVMNAYSIDINIEDDAGNFLAKTSVSDIIDKTT